MKRFVLLLSVLGVALLALTTAYFSAQTSAHDRGEAELKAATPEDLETRAKAEPTNGRVFYYLGRARAQSGDAGKAQSALNQAAVLLPKSEEIALARIALARRMGDEAGAYEMVTDYLKIAPDSADARIELVSLLSAAGSHFKAIQEAAKVVELRPKDAKLWRLLATEYLAARQPKAAEEALLQATTLAPDDWRSQTLLGDSRAQQGKFAEALPAYEAAAKLAPDEGIVLMGLGAARLNAAKSDAEVKTAMEPLKKAAAALPNAPKPRVDLAQAYLRTGNGAEARKLLEKARQLAPAIPEIPLRLARVLRQQGDKAGAEREQKEFEKLRDYALQRDKLLGEQQNKGYSAARQIEIARLCLANGDAENAIRQYRYVADDAQFGAEARAALEKLASSLSASPAQKNIIPAP